MLDLDELNEFSTKLALEVDEDALKVLKFMEGNMRAAKLVPVAELVAKLAPILWGYFDREELYPVHIHRETLIKRKNCEKITD